MNKKNEEYMDCGILLKLISDHLQSHCNNMLNEINLTFSQLRYLDYLNQNGGLASFKKVEKYFQTSQPTVSGMMRRLAEKNLIEIEASEFGRAKNARLTEKGKKLVDESGVNREHEESMILSALREDEREAFHDMLVRVNEKFSE